MGAMFRKRPFIDPRLAALGLTADEARALSRHASIVMARPGAHLTDQGAPHAQIVWLVSGSAVVERDGSPITTLGPGDVVGEITMLTDRHEYTADVVVLEPSLVAALSRQEWAVVEREAPTLCTRLRLLADQRLAAQAA